MTLLLDTNVVSEPRRRKADPTVMAWLRAQDQAELFMSVLTVGEIISGAQALARRDPVAGRSLLSWFSGVRKNYGERVLPVTEPIAETWASLQALRPLPVVDGLLAATAMVHASTLVTRNERDFEGLGIQLLNPWP